MRLLPPVLFVVLAACSGTPTAMQILAAEDAGDGTAGGPDTRADGGAAPDVEDAGSDADVDAQVDAGPDVYVPGACGLDSSETSDSCGIGTTCGTDSCARGRFYGCRDHKRPPIPGCARLDGGVQGDFCCPAACVRASNTDAACDPAGTLKSWVCPVDNGQSPPLPSSSCRTLDGNNSVLILCCP